MNRTELLQHRINQESRRELIEDRIARIDARRFTGEPPTGFGLFDPVIRALMADPNLDPAFKTALTPEEIAEDERMAQEQAAEDAAYDAELERSEEMAERNWTLYDAPTGGRL